MKLVNVARLREKLIYYLNLVKKGEELVVTSHRRRVARLIPASAPSGEITEPTRPVEDLHNIKGVKLKRSVSAVRLLLSDRRADEDRR